MLTQGRKLQGSAGFQVGPTDFNHLKTLFIDEKSFFAELK